MEARPKRKGSEGFAGNQRKMRIYGQRSSGGIMLLECLVYMAVLSIVLTLSYKLMYKSWATHISIRRNAADIATAMIAGERWRKDIRASNGPIETKKGDGN